VAQNLEIISKIFSTNQNSAHGIYDSYHIRTCHVTHMNGPNHTSLSLIQYQAYQDSVYH